MELERVARKLAAAEGDEKLCVACWFREVREIPPDDLATVMLGLLQRIQALEKHADGWSSPDILKVLPNYPNVYPTAPYTGTPAVPVTFPTTVICTTSGTTVDSLGLSLCNSGSAACSGSVVYKYANISGAVSL